MKLLILLYLEDDEAVVNRLLEEKGINAFSRLPVEGHGAGIATGWYGQIAPYRSRLIFSIVPADDARAVLEAAKGPEVADNRGPRGAGGRGGHGRLGGADPRRPGVRQKGETR